MNFLCKKLSDETFLNKDFGQFRYGNFPLGQLQPRHYLLCDNLLCWTYILVELCYYSLCLINVDIVCMTKVWLKKSASFGLVILILYWATIDIEWRHITDRSATDPGGAIVKTGCRLFIREKVRYYGTNIYTIYLKQWWKHSYLAVHMLQDWLII